MKLFAGAWPWLLYAAALLEFEDFGLERRQVLLPPIVGEAAEAQPLEHLGPLRRPAVLGVERNDAPSHEVLPREEPSNVRLVRGARRECGNDEGCEDRNGNQRAMHGVNSPTEFETPTSSSRG